MERPSFSIVMPTYQRREVVCDAVRALSTLDYDGPIEIIIVVDGSTDGTESALAEISCPFPKRIVAQRNTGLAGARNRGAAEASHDIILFLDDDMMAAPDLLREHARSHAEGADVVMGHIPLDPASPDGFLAQGVNTWAEERSRRFGDGGSPVLFDLVSGHLSIRRALFQSVGGFDESFTAGGTFGDEDLDFAIRLKGICEVCFNPKAIARQRYVVTPRQNLRQWKQAGQSDVLFARKHPEYAAEIFDLHGRSRWRTRFILRPLASVPGLPSLFASVAASIADREASLPPLLRRSVSRLFSAARDLLYWRAVRCAGEIPSADRALVLCYHAITDLSGDPVLSEYGVDRETFARQLDALSRRGFRFISPSEFERFLTGAGRLPRRAALVTFDDCYGELVGVARDVLQPRRINAIAFAVTGMKSGTNEWDQKIGARTLRLLDPDGLRELGRRGVEVGCHSESHTPLPRLSDRDLVEETRLSRERLASMDARPPRFFAYPHGANDERSRGAVKAAGFEAAFALIPSHVSSRSDRFAIPRIEILARDSGWRFWLKTTWPWISRLLQPDPFHVRLRRRAAQMVNRLKAKPVG